jgi:hypothetical protein
MPMLPRGMPQFIVPEVDVGNVPAGVNLHDTRQMQLLVDPHIQGQSFTVDLGALQTNPRGLTNAVTTSGVRGARSMPDFRLRAVQAMHSAAEAAKTATAQDPIAPLQAVSRQTGRAVTTSELLAPMSSPTRAPLRALHVGRDDAAATVRAPVTGSAERMVTFDFRDAGEHRATYRDVLISADRDPNNSNHLTGGFVVLVVAARSSHYYFPPKPRPGMAPIAFSVDGDPSGYLVMPTGMQYIHGGHEYCILTIVHGWLDMSQALEGSEL